MEAGVGEAFRSALARRSRERWVCVLNLAKSPPKMDTTSPKSGVCITTEAPPIPPAARAETGPVEATSIPLSSSETEPHRSVCSPHLLGPAAREGSGGYLGRRRPPGKGQAWVWKCPPLRIRTSVIPPDPWELPHPQRPRARPEPRTHLCQQSPREAGAVCALIMASLHGPGGFQQSRPSR